VDGLLRVRGFEEEELGYYAGGDGLVDGAVETYYSFLRWVNIRAGVMGWFACLEETGEYVVFRCHELALLSWAFMPRLVL